MKLREAKIITFVHDEYEDLEFWYPILRLQEEGIKVFIAGEEAGKVYKGKYGVPAKADIDYTQTFNTQHDGLLIPGGWAPDKLRRFEEIQNRKTSRQRKKGNRPHLSWGLGFDFSWNTKRP